MKKLHTLLFCFVTIFAFSQEPVEMIKFTEPEMPPQGFYIEAAYSYNFRGVMADFLEEGDSSGTFKPTAYLSGHMPSVSVGYKFKNRVGVYASFSMPFTQSHWISSNNIKKATGWYNSLGGQFYFSHGGRRIQLYAKAAINGGVFKIHTTGIAKDEESRGGYALGGTLAIGADVRLCNRFYLFTEVSLTHITYKPKEWHDNVSGETKQYSNDVSDGYHPVYGWIYTSQYELQEYFRMNFISASIGFRYNFFGW